MDINIEIHTAITVELGYALVPTSLLPDTPEEALPYRKNHRETG